MTLIAGVRCSDGFLLAADSAVETQIVYQGDKLYWHKWGPCRVYVALCGDLNFAKMAWEQIRDEASKDENHTASSFKALVKTVIERIYRNDVATFVEIHKDEAVPDFYLIVGFQTGNDFKIFSTVTTTIAEINNFEFRGTGSVVAQYLGDTLLRNPGTSALSIPIAVAVHLVIEIFRVAKLHGVSVGFDTQVVAWRSSSSTATFTAPRSNYFSEPTSDISAIQSNLRLALWHAFSKTNLPPGFDGPNKQITFILEKIRDHTEKQGFNASHLTIYKITPESGGWSMENEDIPPPNPQD